MSRPSSVPFDRVALEYEETRGGAARGETMATLLQRHLPEAVEGRPIAEIGIGTGIVALALAKHGHQIIGVDLAPGMLALAAARFPGRVGVADAHTLPIGSDRVAAAYLVWVLHVVANPQQVLAELVRVVEPGGLVLTVPAHSWFNTNDEMDAAHAPLEVLRPSQPTPDDVAGWLRDAGLEEVVIDHIEDESNHSPNDAADELERKVWSMLWDLDEDRWNEVVAPVIAHLRGLPEPDRERVRRHRSHLVVGRVPS